MFLAISWTTADEFHSCERSNAWLDETSYAIDTSLIPRGGHRRRKSMEPAKARQSLIPTTVGVSSRRTTIMSPTKEFLNLSSSPAPAGHSSPAPFDIGKVTFAPTPSKPATPVAAISAATTPLPVTPTQDVDELTASLSPTTPYFLHPANLVQKTCPPKQTQQPLFPRQEGKVDEVKKKLELLRRRSLGSVPKVGSPLRF